MAELYYEWILYEVDDRSRWMRRIRSVESQRLCELVQRAESIDPYSGHHYHLELHRTLYTGSCDYLARLYIAEVIDGVLEDYFVLDGMDKRRRVPSRFHDELKKYKKRLDKMSECFLEKSQK